MREAKRTAVWKALAANPRIIKTGPGILRFLCGYMRKFRVQDSGGDLILHSHLPPVNSDAYARFIDEHLIGRSEGPHTPRSALRTPAPSDALIVTTADGPDRRWTRRPSSRPSAT